MAEGSYKKDMGYLLGQTSRWLRSLLAEELRFHGLTDSSYIVLYFAKEAGPAGVSSLELASRIEMPFEEMEATVKLLERGGWVVGKPDPGNRDSRVVSITQKTQAILPVLTDAAHWSIERALNGFTEEEVAQLTSYLERMQDNLR